MAYERRWFRSWTVRKAWILLERTGPTLLVEARTPMPRLTYIQSLSPHTFALIHESVPARLVEGALHLESCKIHKPGDEDRRG